LRYFQIVKKLKVTFSGAVIFTPCSLGTNGLKLNHTHSMSLSDLELQHDQTWAVLPIIQRKYSCVGRTFLNLLCIFLIHPFTVHLLSFAPLTTLFSHSQSAQLWVLKVSSLNSTLIDP
jgi:hypothetical protein